MKRDQKNMTKLLVGVIVALVGGGSADARGRARSDAERNDHLAFCSGQEVEASRKAHLKKRRRKATTIPTSSKWSI